MFELQDESWTGCLLGAGHEFASFASFSVEARPPAARDAIVYNWSMATVKNLVWEQ